MNQKRALVRRPRASDERYFEERCHILEVWNSRQDPAVSLARARVEAGVTTRLHRLHGIVERYFIIQGRGEVELGTLTTRVVGPGDLAYIPAGCPQRITNTGTDDLIFLAICTPRFVQEAYQDIDDGG